MKYESLMVVSVLCGLQDYGISLLTIFFFCKLIKIVFILLAEGLCVSNE